MILQKGSGTAVEGPIIPGLIAVGCLSKGCCKIAGHVGDKLLQKRHEDTRVDR
jgi:hypothetical protein